MGFLKNKTAIVTGASRGIGRAIALMLAAEGCDVAFSYRKSRDAAKSLESEIKEKGCRVKASRVDIRNFDQVKAWVEKTRKHFGRLDILVNNAGIIIDKALMLMGEDDWKGVIDTNLNGTFNATRACIVSFLKQKSGQIINISSVSGSIGLPRQVNYSASKGGMNAFTRALAKEVAAYGVRVNAVAPGFIETDMLAGLDDKYKEQVLSFIPLGRIGRVADVAAAVRFLLSEQGRYITGQILHVDGGLAMKE